MRMRVDRWRGVLSVAAAVAASLTLGTPGTASAQGLADFDYENLSFRGFGPEWGYIWPSRVQPTQTVGIRMDLGYLGPGLRIVPGLTYWKSDFKAGEIQELEDRVASLIVSQTDEPAPTVDLGRIDWSDIALSLDGQLVWRVPSDLLTFLGAGAAVHLLNGNGTAINGTFVEDLLDSVTAGFNLHAGLEYLMWPKLRVNGQARYEVMGDLQYFGIRTGVQFMLGPSAPGEERTR